MIYVSHAANVAILTAVCFAFWKNTAGLTEAFGPDTPARRILLCVYCAILLVSTYALVRTAFGDPLVACSIAAVLFPLQIGYKLATVAAVGLQNPVVATNLAVVILHSITLAVVWLSA